MSPYRVLVVDDSAFMRKVFCDLIATDTEFEIVATAKNGREALDAVRRFNPNVITMDLEMPEMNGLEAMRQIMRLSPTPIIMVSGISDDGAKETIKALQSGAFDFIRKPTGPTSPDIQAVGEQLLEKMRIAVLTKRPAQLSKPSAPQPFANNKRTDLGPTGKGSTGIPAKNGPAAPAKAPDRQLAEHPPREAKSHMPPDSPPAEPSIDSANKAKPSASFRDLIVIGTSTGGPRALHEVITALPGSLPAPVLVVQHMPPKFTLSLAQRLDSFSELNVTEASDGQRVYAGVVYIAPGGYHMKLGKDHEGYRIQLTLDPPRNGHRPSVDVMFESCVPFPELRRHSVIMTGMGSDGAKGMKALNDSGGASAIAEAEESCVVYGMPRSAAEAGAARKIVPLQKIASALVEAVAK